MAIQTSISSLRAAATSAMYCSIAMIANLFVFEGAHAEDMVIESYGLPFTGNSATSIGNIIKVLIQYVGLLALLSITYGGLLMLLSYGDDGKIKNAKKIIMFSAMGIVISGASYLIIDAINALKV